MDGGKFKLVGKFKMALGDMVSIRGQVMEYTYIPTGIKRELVRSGVDCDWKGKSSGLLVEDRWPFIVVDNSYFGTFLSTWSKNFEILSADHLTRKLPKYSSK